MSPEFLEVLRIKNNKKRFDLMPRMGRSSKKSMPVANLPSLSKLKKEMTEEALDRVEKMVDVAFARIEKTLEKHEADKAKNARN